MELPQSRALRITLGGTLTVAGALGGWLPILGYWMVPLGLVILSVDIPRVRRSRRKITVSTLRWWRGSKRPAVTDVAEPGGAAGKAPLRDPSIVP
jgi:hypothetical protein